jgi:hypothetical protein
MVAQATTRGRRQPRTGPVRDATTVPAGSGSPRRSRRLFHRSPACSTARRPSQRGDRRWSPRRNHEQCLSLPRGRPALAPDPLAKAREQQDAQQRLPASVFRRAVLALDKHRDDPSQSAAPASRCGAPDGYARGAAT